MESWKAEFKQWLMQSASDLDDFFDIRARRLRKRLGRQGVAQIQPYIGMANDQSIHLHGRVLTNPPTDERTSEQQWYENLLDSYRRFASHEVAGAVVQAEVDEVRQSATSDNEGYLHVELPLRSTSRSSYQRGTAEDRSNDDWTYWQKGRLRVMESKGSTDVDRDAVVDCDFIRPSSDAEYGVISDIDDTILHTGATDLTTMAKLTFFGNARTRSPIAGASALYSVMHGGGEADSRPINPVFYVSSSPWNLFDLLDDFLELNAFPHGPILLRDLGFDDNMFIKTGHDHKLQKARRIMALYPDLPFVLFGDSGQEDARLYADAAEEFGDRIRAIFIRNVDPAVDRPLDLRVQQHIERASKAGVPTFLIEDSIRAGQQAIDLGLLPATAMSYIERECRRDEERATGMGRP